MRLHLYELGKADAEGGFDDLQLIMVPFLFQLVGWALAIAALGFLHAKTGEPVAGVLFNLSGILVFLYTNALVRRRFDFAIWPRPVEDKWKRFAEALTYGLIGSVVTIGVMIIATRLADAAVKAGVF